MGDWPILSDGGKPSQLGANTATSYGTAVAPSATAHTKGSWTQLAASIPGGSWLFINAGNTTGIATGFTWLLDLAIGAAGSEVVIVSDLVVVGQRYHPFTGNFYLLPLSVPPGVRLSARCQANSASQNSLYVTVMVLSPGFLPSATGAILNTMGAVEASTTGTSLTSGAANTKGAWVELAAATARRYFWLNLAILDWNNESPKLIDLGIGAAGSETVLMPNLFCQASATGGGSQQIVSLPVNIPAGSRLAARFQDSAASKTLEIVLYGLG